MKKILLLPLIITSLIGAMEQQPVKRVHVDIHIKSPRTCSKLQMVTAQIYALEQKMAESIDTPDFVLYEELEMLKHLQEVLLKKYECNRRYREAHKKEQAELKHRNYQINKEKKSAQSRRYHQEHRDEIAKRKQQYYQKYKDKRKELDRKQHEAKGTALAAASSNMASNNQSDDEDSSGTDSETDNEGSQGSK